MATSLPTTVLLVEDDPLARHAYRSLLESLAPSIRLVGEAASPEAALEHAFREEGGAEALIHLPLHRPQEP